jgi:hypothetical protein
VELPLAEVGVLELDKSKEVCLEIRINLNHRIFLNYAD